jgi:hypothetical protein
MRVLLTIAHYFKAEEHDGRPKYASTDPALRDVRAKALGRMLFNWVAHQGPASVLNIEKKAFEIHPGPTQLDIVLVVQGDNHLVAGSTFQGQNVTVERTEIENPRMLGFECHRVMAERAGDYDLYCFSEDDLLSQDPLFFLKVAAFQKAFGPTRTLMPNRFEINMKGPSFKTYVDGPLRRHKVERIFEIIPDEMTLRDPSLLGDPLFERATNPHSGFFAISAEQLAHWRAQPWFLNRDTQFIGPLESAATLGVLQTFSVYKSAGSSLGWLQIEHLDRKFSIHDFPKIEAGADAPT